MQHQSNLSVVNFKCHSNVTFELRNLPDKYNDAVAPKVHFFRVSNFSFYPAKSKTKKPKLFKFLSIILITINCGKLKCTAVPGNKSGFIKFQLYYYLPHGAKNEIGLNSCDKAFCNC